MDSGGTGQVTGGERGVNMDMSVLIECGSEKSFTHFLAELLKEAFVSHHSFDGV